ncbi:type I-C CRISPR-associated protein Cas8c/Csd1 [Actinomadura kijaniata]|uniref:CRISPR-associated protein Csd1 n=1 Tax=Actinomadura namibiensis TaxID=182080 RepID=A0A7W3LYI8_ACTNM|nr:type I-C CRISPR-associated protein Cas8c/Csd1 [Actinomadura namibiensis]MBA8956573.1 CRISPR-associated protein Csd1 [Actinomadura namibiensis]
MPIRQLVEFAAHEFGDTGPRYYRSRAVRWLININRDGTGTLVDRADADNKSGGQEATPFLTRTSGVAAMLLADTLEYVFGIAKDNSDKAQAGADRRNDAYLQLLHDWHTATGDPVAALVCDFFDQEKHLALIEALPEDASPSEIAAVMVDNEWCHRRPSAIEFWGQVARNRKSSGQEGICLACHKHGPMLKTVPDMVKSTLIPVGVDAKGRPKRGRDAALVSVNTSAQGRGGDLQLVNTPLCEGCGAQAMAALNHLLGHERHRRRGDDSVLTWWLRTPDTFDPMLFEQPSTTEVKALLDEVYQGKHRTQANPNDFYALTLSANQSRVVVRDWVETPVAQIKEHLAAWFTDHGSFDRWSDGIHYVPLRTLVRASGRWDRVTKQYVPGTAAHGLERDLLRAALHGTPPPSSLLPQLLQRIRSDHNIDLARVALLRLVLTRPPFKEKTMPGLDETDTTPAYVWGRMFAVLEAIQRKALPDVNATIRDRFFGLAMTQPEATMRMLRLNANGHLKKLLRGEKTRGSGRALDQRLADLYQLLDAKEGLPPHLDSRGQARFILGYEQQRSADMAAARAAREAKEAEKSDDTPDTEQ